MNRLLQNRLFLQLAFTSIAAVSVSTLSVMLITDAVRNAEGVLVREAHQSLSTATQELVGQYRYRVSSDTAWVALPISAKDISSQAITQTVLRSYPGVEGGFYDKGGFIGYGFPTHDSAEAKTDMPVAERSWITGVVKASLDKPGEAQQLFRGKQDLIVIHARADRHTGSAAWAMRRLAGRSDPVVYHRELMLTGLVVAALFSIVGTLTTGIGLQRGVAEVNRGLLQLESDFSHRLPARSDELGVISRSVNRMASVHGELEAELRREDRLRALGQMAAGLAHEIRNPLNSIRLTVQLLEQRLKTNSIHPEDLAMIKTEVDRLNLLSTDLLNLKRIDLQQESRPSGQNTPARQPVSPVLEHCLRLTEGQARLRNQTLTVKADQKLPSAFFEPRQLTQAVVNVLLNALEATPDGGNIQVSSREVECGAEIEIWDQGPGLTPAQEEHLFEAFYTTKPKGTGLGLVVSRELMRKQGGDLVHRAGNPGARFVILLPNEPPC